MEQSGHLKKMSKSLLTNWSGWSRQLQQEISNRSRVEDALSRELEITRFCRVIQQAAFPAPVDDISLLVLKHAKRLTGASTVMQGILNSKPAI